MVRIGMKTGKVYDKDFPRKDINECCTVVKDDAEDDPSYPEFLRRIKHSCDVCYAIHGCHCGKLNGGTFGLALAEEVTK